MENRVQRIRRDVEDCVGKNIILRANKGRKKIVTRKGVLEAAYPSVFVVKIKKPDDTVRSVTYTYGDILTNTVEIHISAEALNGAAS